MEPQTGWCECCQRDNALLGPSRAPDGLPAAVRVCGICTRHLGDHKTAVTKREQQHREMWAEDLADALQRRDEAHAAVVQSLRRELEERPTRIVVENLDKQRVEAAFDQRNAAYRSRDKAFRALSEIHLRHHDAGGEECSCGKSLKDCDLAAVVDGYPALKGWERRQWELRRDGLPHHLPPGHPGVLDFRWEPDGDSQEAADEFGYPDDDL